jgi:predicted aspartyl protease
MELFKGVNGQLYLTQKVIINGIYYNALVDTGSSDTIITHKVFSEVNLLKGKEVKLLGIGNKKSFSSTCTICVKNKSLVTEVIVCDLQQLNKPIKDKVFPNISVILGLKEIIYFKLFKKIKCFQESSIGI